MDTPANHPATPSNETATQAEPYFVNRLRILQVMQAVLRQPASKELKAFIEKHMLSENDPTMLAFMHLLVTDNERNRDIAYTIFKDLEAETAAAQAALMDTPNEAPIPTQDTPAETETVEVEDTVEVKEEAVVQDVVNGVRPFHVIDSEDMEKVTFTLNSSVDDVEVQPMTTYSIITKNSNIELTRNVNRVMGIVMGVRDQLNVEHGFGFVLPLGGNGLVLDRTGKERCLIKIAMSYPSTFNIFDAHEGIHSTDISYFFALHELMTKGYRFMLDLDIAPIGQKFALMMQPSPLFDRVDASGEALPILSSDLKALSYALEKLDFIGFLGGEHDE